MGVMVDGVWHEELADPNPEGGSNLSSSGGGGSAPPQDPRATSTNQYGDGIFNTPNGQKTGTQIVQELRAVGWDGVGDPVDVYNRTASGGAPAPGTPGLPTTTVPVQDPAVAQLGAQIDALMNAVGSGNAQAFAEAVRQFNVSFGLDQNKFTEAIRQFNENLAIAQSGLTGTFQGQQTLPAQEQYFQQGVTAAGLTGTYGGQQTLAAQQQAEAIAAQRAGLTGMYQQPGVGGTGQQTLAAQQQAFAQQQALAEMYGQAYGGGFGAVPTGQQTLAAQQQAHAQQLGAIQTAAGLQANPFRQAQVIGQLGGLLGGRGVAGFQAPGAAQGQTDFSGMGNMQRLIDDIRGGPNAINSQSTQSVLDAIPTPTKLDSVNFARSSPLTQSLVLQGMSEKYGLSAEDALSQIRATLPQFTSPTTFAGIRR